MILLLLLGAAPPPFVVEPPLHPASEIVAAATNQWDTLARLFEAVAGPVPGGGVIRLRAGKGLLSHEAGRSVLGEIRLRQKKSGILDEIFITTLRHELAHQLLLQVCPAASRDALLHESWALSVSGELSAWTDGKYLSTPEALRILERGQLDTPNGRRALARLLADNLPPGRALPVPVERRLKACASGQRWTQPMTLAELSTTQTPVGDAWIVISRHSGEVIESSGKAGLPMPFGSVLKPFVWSGAAPRPRLSPNDRPEWACQHQGPMDGATAVLRSCNGWFLDWGREAPRAAQFGRYGPLLLELGLARLPQDMTEAIGIRPTLALSPWAVAQAYRVLAESDLEALRILYRNHLEGTLTGLPFPPNTATKTGTVRSAGSVPELGWLVAVDADRVFVKVRVGQPPRHFAAQVAAQVEKRQPQLAPAEVAAPSGPWTCPLIWELSSGLRSTSDRSGRFLCVGAPWNADGRPFAGILEQQRLRTTRERADR